MFRWRWLGANLAWVLGLFLVFRLLFFGWNYTQFQMASIADIVLAFVHGIRFDLSAIAISYSPILLLVSLPEKLLAQKFWQNFLKIVFIVITVISIGVNLTDVELFNFSGKRMTIELFSLKQDIQQHFFSLVVTYWKLLISFVVCVAALLWSYRPLKITQSRYPLGAMVMISLLAVLLARGGWQYKPLRPVHAFTSGSTLLGALTLNTTFTLLKSKSSPSVMRRNDFGDSQIRAVLGNALKKSSQFGRFKDYNVVILIVESLAAEYIGFYNNGQGFTPFVDSLLQKSFHVAGGFANGRRSIEALPSILAGIPSLMEEPLITSNYQTNHYRGLAEALGKFNYRSLFFHGAHNGSMFFDSFAKRLGFQEYYGRNEYPDLKDDDGQWGIFDEPFLKFTAQKLNEQKLPFLATIFTLSSHHPYRIPQQYQGKFPKGTLPIHESIGYADLALKNFFSTASEMPWYKKTIFVLTADHTQLSQDSRYADFLGPHRVPILFFIPNMEWGAENSADLGQHVDIMPSILDLLGIELDEQVLFGRSLFVDDKQDFAINYMSSGFYALDVESVLEQNPLSTTERCHRHKLTWLLPSEPLGSVSACQILAKKISAYKQYYFNGLLDNSWLVRRVQDTATLAK